MLLKLKSRATNDAKYLTKAEQYYSSFGMGGKPWTFSWDDKKAGVQLLLAEITQSEISIILHMIQKPNSIIVLLFIQNNS